MARSSSSKKRRSKGLEVDFTGVEAGARTVKDGKYKVAVHSVSKEESKDDEPYLAWQFKVISKKGKGAVLYDNTSLQPQALWRLRLLLEALGEEIPDGVMSIDPDSYVGREFEVEVTNEKWEGKDRSRITTYFVADEEGEESDDDDDDKDEDDEDDEEEEKKSSKKDKKKSKKKDEDDEEEEDDEKDEDDDDDDDDEEDDKKSKKKDKDKKSSSKIKVGSKVKFKDNDDKTVKGIVTNIDDDTVTVEDSDDEEWEIEMSELTLV